MEEDQVGFRAEAATFVPDEIKVDRGAWSALLQAGRDPREVVDNLRRDLLRRESRQRARELGDPAIGACEGPDFVPT